MMSSNRQTVTRRMGISRLTGCEQVENKSWRWVSTVWMDGMGSRNVVRLTYRGFCLGFEGRLGSGFKVQEKRIWEVLEVVDNSGQD